MIRRFLARRRDPHAHEIKGRVRVIDTQMPPDCAPPSLSLQPTGTAVKHRLRVHKDPDGLWLYALLDTTKTPGNQIVAAGAGDAWGDVMRRGCAYLTANRAHQCCNVNRDRCWCPQGCDCQCEGCGCS